MSQAQFSDMLAINIRQVMERAGAAPELTSGYDKMSFGQKLAALDAKRRTARR
jgi:hypothetical protein